VDLLLLNQEIKKVKKKIERNETGCDDSRAQNVIECGVGSAYSVWSIISTLIRSELTGIAPALPFVPTKMVKMCSIFWICNENVRKRNRNLINLKFTFVNRLTRPIFWFLSDYFIFATKKKERGAEWFSLRNTRRHLCLSFEQYKTQTPARNASRKAVSRQHVGYPPI
jgi:hypothetical protein